MVGAARGLHRRIDLRERQLRMLHECPAGVGQLDTAYPSGQQGGAHFILEIANLPAQRRLRRVQSLFGCDRETSFLGDRDEIAQVTQFHDLFHAFQV